MDLNSPDWCEIVFEGRNKEYGAYNMRRTSSKRHILSFLVTLVAAVFFFVIPEIIETVYVPDYSKVKMDESLRITILDLENAKDFESFLKQLQTTPSPPTFTEPVIGDVFDYDDSLVEIPLSVESELEDFLEHSIDIPADAAEMFDVPGDDVIADDEYLLVDVMPAFPGGNAAFVKYLSANLQYPAGASQANKQGTVICQFVVNKDGSILDLKIVQGVDTRLDREALRVLKLMPKWNPGERNGEKVKVRFTVPIVFRL